MLIGSNNSLTYLKPSNIFSRLKHWFTKSQEIPYDEQYTFWGIRYFDLGLYVTKDNQLLIRDIGYKQSLSSLYQILDFFEKRGDVILNITFDASFTDQMSSNYQKKQDKFKEICHVIDNIYHNIIFVGGSRNFDGKVIYEFKKRENNYASFELISPSKWSPVYRFVSNWLPFLIGGLNKKYIEKFKDKHVFLVLNYINRR